MEEVIKASLPCVKRAHTKYLKPKESYSKTVVDHCQQRLMFAKTLNRAEDLTIQAELNEVSKYLHASNVTFLHMLMNISGQPYEPQTLQVRLILPCHCQLCHQSWPDHMQTLLPSFDAVVVPCIYA